MPASRERERKGEGSLSNDGTYYRYSYGYTQNGENKKKKWVVGRTEDFRDEGAAWAAAKQLRDDFIGRLKNGHITLSSINSVTCDELLNDYIAYLKRDVPRSAYVIEKCIAANVRPYFGKIKAAELETAHFRAYRAKRKKEDEISDTTVNRDLSYLRAALFRGKNHHTPPKVKEIPYFDMANEEKNVRKGFLELEGYGDVLEALPISLKCLFVCAYHVGNRKGAMLALKWLQVDFKNRVLYLEDEQKVEPVVAPIYGDMKVWLEQQKKYRDEHYPEQEFVFFWYPFDCEIDPELKTGHGGRRTAPGARITTFRESWRNAVAAAGHPGLLFHDLRRSAVRNLIRLAGLSEKEAMEISGHKTDAMIRRYNIKGNQDAQRLGKRLDEFWKTQTATRTNVKMEKRRKVKP